MKVAIIHELWGAGASRCVTDLVTHLGAKHAFEFFPKAPNETALDLLRYLDTWEPDVVNCHSFTGHYEYELLNILSHRYPTCFTVHDPRPIGVFDVKCWECNHNRSCFRCPLLSAPWRRILKNPYFAQRMRKRWTHSRCDPRLALISPSRWLAGRLRDHELSRFRIEQIPYGIDAATFDKQDLGANRFPGLPPGKRVILHSAWHQGRNSLNVRKGLPTLFEAFEQYIVPQYSDVVLAVAGESCIPNHPSVIPLGMVPHEKLPELFSSVSVYVLATLGDNLPFSIMEALSCETPVIATNVGGVPELVMDGINGSIVPPNDAASLGAALKNILDNPRTALAWGREGRRHIMQNFSMSAFSQAYERLFMELKEERKK